MGTCVSGVACERAQVPAAGSSAAPVAPPASRIAPPPADAASHAACREESTAPLPSPRDYGSAQNLRVAASADGALISWETLSQPAIGDSSQVGFAAFLRHRGGKPDVITTVALPARSYAAAAYTSLAPTRVGAKLDLLTYGVTGTPTFATYAGGAAPWRGLSVFSDTGPEALHATVLPFAVTESLAVAADYPLAILGGEEAPCESYYQCTEQYEPARLKGLTKSVRTLVLIDDSPRSEILYRGTSKLPAKTFAPAVAIGGKRAFAIFRVDARLDGAFVGLDGKRQRGFTIATGDVGAPAVVFFGDRFYAAWAERGSAGERYRLKLASIGDSGVDAAALLDTGAESAFAPALTASAGKLFIAWMEGDDGRRGRVRRGVVETGTLVLDERTDASPDGGNRRDPEIAAAGERVYLAWSDFTRDKAGIPVLQTLVCR